jgi:hypothetical protein
MLMSDVGSGFFSASNAVITFDDTASTNLSDGVVSGTYKPTDVNDGADNLPSPAPGSPNLQIAGSASSPTAPKSNKPTPLEYLLFSFLDFIL